jgi:two-component system chemotaxis response regulator CheB
LSEDSQLPVQFAEHDKTFSTGVYIAPPDCHLLIGETSTFLSAGPKENHTRPAIDPMFRSAAANHGDRVIGVLLTGYLQDGMNGFTTFIGMADAPSFRIPQMPRCRKSRLTRCGG